MNKRTKKKKEALQKKQEAKLERRKKEILNELQEVDAWSTKIKKQELLAELKAL